MKEEKFLQGRRDVVRKGIKIMFWSCGICETDGGNPAGNENAF